MQRSGAHNKLGSLGENLAADFLIGKGYEILERNLDLNVGEIDLLCQKDDIIVIVEVKTLSMSSYLDPIHKIDRRKQVKLRLLARVIANRYDGCNIRCDAVTVCWDRNKQLVIRHLENIC